MSVCVPPVALLKIRTPIVPYSAFQRVGNVTIPPPANAPLLLVPVVATPAFASPKRFTGPKARSQTAAPVRALGVVEAPVAAFAGRRIFRERLTAVQWAAGAMVAIGVAMTALG